MTNFYAADSNNAIIRITVSSCLVVFSYKYFSLFFDLKVQSDPWVERTIHFSLKCDFAAKLSFFPISSYKL